ncbi:MAG: lysoplasmalogenase [Anaerolineae bacterium]
MSASTPARVRVTPFTWLLAAIALITALLYLLGDQLGGPAWLHLTLKPVPVLALALWVSGLPMKGRYQLFIALGLLLSALGDILLEMSEATFLIGLGAFLLAHVAYIAAFLQDTRKLYPFHGAAAYIYGFLALGFLLTTGNLGGMMLPVQLYVLVITTMLWRAAVRLDLPQVPRFSVWAGLFGALFFVLSDTILAFRLFETPIQLGGWAVMITYWLGQFGLALSAWRRPARAISSPTNSGGAPRSP